MVPHYGYGKSTATSASVESFFNDLKNRVFKHTVLPLRVDDFILHHIKSVEGSMKLAVADTKEEEQVPQLCDADVQEDCVREEKYTNSSINESVSRPTLKSHDELDTAEYSLTCNKSI